MKDRDMVSAAAVDYLMYSGYMVMAYFWALMADRAHSKLKQAEGNGGFYQAKIQTAEIYYDRLLPRAKTHGTNMLKSSKSLMSMSEENFDFLG